jgi:hypothetical protein
MMNSHDVRFGDTHEIIDPTVKNIWSTNASYSMSWRIGECQHCYRDYDPTASNAMHPLVYCSARCENEA